MLIIDRYVIRKGIPPFFYSLFTFIVLMTVIDMFEKLDLILKNQVPAAIVLRYYMLMVPSFLAEISPLAALIGSIFTFHNLSRFNEISAIKASGTHLFRIILPFFFFGLMISLTNIIVNETILPRTAFQWSVLKEKYFRDQSTGSENYMKHNIALKASDNAYFIKEYDVENKEMNNVTILQYNTLNRIARRINAEKAKWTGVGWIFYNGIIYNYDKEDQNKSVVMNFSEKFLQITEKPDIFERKSDLSMMTVRELKHHIQTMRDNGYDTSKEEVTLHMRLALPFASIIVLFIGIPFMLSGSSHSLMKGIIASIAITFFYKIASIIGLSLGNGGNLPPLLAAWLMNILFSIFGFTLLTTVRT